jgi:mevalonate pyrophosphate decarboxylase
VAPESFTAGFNHSFIKAFYGKIDPELRMPREKCVATTTVYVSETTAQSIELMERVGYWAM